MAHTQTQSAVMVSTAAKFDEINNSLTAMLNKLMFDLSALHGSWKGLAATEFERVKTQYAEDLSDLNRALSETATAIRSSSAGYDASDDRAAERVTSSGGSSILPL